MMNIPRCLTFLFVIFSIPVLSQAQSVGIDWIEDGRIELDSTATGIFFVYITNDHCLPCIRMESSTFQDPDVVRVLNGYPTAIKLNCSEFEIADYAYKHIDIVSFPTFLLIDKSGSVISLHSGALDKEELQTILMSFSNLLFSVKVNSQDVVEGLSKSEFYALFKLRQSMGYPTKDLVCGYLETTKKLGPETSRVRLLSSLVEDFEHNPCSKEILHLKKLMSVGIIKL